MKPIKLEIKVSDGSLVITLPLSQIAAYAEGDEYSQVEITDKVAFGAYLARHLQNPKRRDEDLTELLADNIRAVFDDAIYVGAGIRSRLEDIPFLIDRMWKNHEKILTIYEGMPPGMTAHGCLTEAIRTARKGDVKSAAQWLYRGTHSWSEDVAKSLQDNIEEAMNYAIATYGSKFNGSSTP